MNPIPMNHVKRNKHDIMVVVNVNANVPFEKQTQKNGTATNEKTTLENGNEIFSKYLTYFNSIRKKNGKQAPEDKPYHLGYFELMSKSLNLMIHQISELTIELYKPDILINVSKDSFGIYDFHKSAEIIEMGADATRETLKKLV